MVITWRSDLQISLSLGIEVHRPFLGGLQDWGGGDCPSLTLVGIESFAF